MDAVADAPDLNMCIRGAGVRRVCERQTDGEADSPRVLQPSMTSPGCTAIQRLVLRASQRIRPRIVHQQTRPSIRRSTPPITEGRRRAFAAVDGEESIEESRV